MIDTEIFLAARDRLHRRTLFSSGIGLLLSAASRLPTWEVAAPVQWLLGTVNVGFLPILGPIVVFGCYCFTVLGYVEAVGVEKELRAKTDLSELERSIVRNGGVAAPRSEAPPRNRIAVYALWIWTFVVPVMAYAILVDTYFDFVRPGTAGAQSRYYKTRSEEIGDLLLGLGGWGGFKPVTPSISDNLNARAETAEKREEQARIRRVASMIPWIYPPLQTWAYFVGLGVMIFMWRERWRTKAERRRPIVIDPPVAATSTNATLGAE